MKWVRSIDAHGRSLQGFCTLLAILLLPAGSRAAFVMSGIGNPGETVKAASYDWNMAPGGQFSPDTVVMRTSTNLEANWWLATNSTAPWLDYLGETESGDNPTVHWVDEIKGGDAFYVAMTFDYRLNEFSSAIRLPNDLLDAGSSLHVGVRNLGLEDGEPMDVLGSLPLFSEPTSEGPAEIGGLLGLEYSGYSVGLGAGAPTSSALTKAGWTNENASSFEWVKYTDTMDPVDSPLTDDVTLHIRSLRTDLEVTNVTELVYFFDVAESNSTIARDDWVENYGASASPTEEQALDDLVMSWTVNAKAKPYKADPVNSEFDSPSFPSLESEEFENNNNPPFGPGTPEPSRAVLILVGVIAVTCVRRRGP